MIASLGTKIFFKFSKNAIRNQEIFTVLLWPLQWTVFVLVFGTRKSLGSPHIFLCRICSCES